MCFASIFFPAGFHANEIGGKAYRLPAHAQIGKSYVLFLMSIFFNIMAMLVAARICFPRLADIDLGIL